MSSYDDRDDNSIFDIPSTSNSHLLSESLLYSDTGPGGDDLSLSELSIKELPSSVSSEPFSLLAKPKADPATPSGSTDHAQAEAEIEENQLSPEEVDMKSKAKRQADENRREEKLQSDLFILKKLNAGFATYNEALDESGSANEVYSFFPNLSTRGGFNIVSSAGGCPAQTDGCLAEQVY